MALRSAAVATFVAFMAAVMLLQDPQEFKPMEVPMSSMASLLPMMDADTLALQLSKLVQLKTVSDRNAPPSFLPPDSQRNMRRAHELLKSFYPHLFAAAAVEGNSGLNKHVHIQCV